MCKGLELQYLHWSGRAVHIFCRFAERKSSWKRCTFGGWHQFTLLWQNEAVSGRVGGPGGDGGGRFVPQPNGDIVSAVHTARSPQIQRFLPLPQKEVCAALALHQCQRVSRTSGVSGSHYKKPLHGADYERLVSDLFEVRWIWTFFWFGSVVFDCNVYFWTPFQQLWAGLSAVWVVLVCQQRWPLLREPQVPVLVAVEACMLLQ